MKRDLEINMKISKQKKKHIKNNSIKKNERTFEVNKRIKRTEKIKESGK